MTSIAVNSLRLSIEFWLDFHIVKSWWEHMNFANIKEAKDFFDTNKEIINAKPFVKWVGWKRQLIKQFDKLFPLEFNNYFEPFLGWWAVFFNLQKKKSFLSDVNEELINVYKVIQKKPLKLISFLEKQIVSKERFEEIRAWDRVENWQKNYSDIERAGRFIYLNRTCFNWLHRVNSRWEFNVPFGKYDNPDIVQRDNIINTSKLLNKTKAEIKLQSFEKVVEKVKAWDFVYFDPPYDVLTTSANFTSYNQTGFWRDMQIKLRDAFVKLDKKWCYIMLSNHNTDFIREIYDWFRFEIVKAKRNVNSKWSGRGEVEEIVVMNY